MTFPPEELNRDADTPSLPDLPDQDEARSGRSGDQPRLIVGLGASAGGLPALREFFAAVPTGSGAAFVVIQHLLPNHESNLAALLGRHAAIPVQQVTQSTRVLPDHAYVIPPGRFMELRNGELVLTEPAQEHSFHHGVIDHFFNSLGESQQERAVCVVLSGAGSDGSQGIKTVKAHGGLALAQDPLTAEQPDMPKAAISAGLIDQVLAPGALSEFVAKHARHPYVLGEVTEADQAKALDNILSIFRARLGHDFRSYKKNTLIRRTHRRMSLHQIQKMEDYVRLLRENEDEVQRLFRDILIVVTSFFREPEAWQMLQEDILPTLVERCDLDNPIRIWTPGCATGEEVYTLAIVLIETMERAQKRCGVQIFATDIAPDVFDRARAGLYPPSIANDVSRERLERFFEQAGENYRVTKQLREMVVFAPQSLIHDPPFSRLDLVICRNLMIYLDNAAQKKILRLFHFALRADGFLFLGNSETIGSQHDLFEPMSKKWRVYRKINDTRTATMDIPQFRGSHSRLILPTSVRRPANPVSIAQQALLDEYAPAAVLVDRNFDILYHHGSRREYLEQPAGEPTHNLLELARDGLRPQLRMALQRAMETRQREVVHEVRLKSPTNHYRIIRIVVHPIPASDTDGLLLVTFHENPDLASDAETHAPSRDPSHDSVITQMEEELDATRRELRGTIEEMEVANEELKASNEEVMSMNEELQSANEELETSKEELQSLNEELATVNNELRDKVQELEDANNDLANLMTSSHMATLFLDRQMRVKRFTPAVTELMHLVPSDIGRPVAHIARRFDDPDLIEDAQCVLANLVPVQKEFAHDEGRWYIRRIYPYRTNDERIAGVVITFIDITERRDMELQIRASEEQFRLAVLESPLPVALIAEDGDILQLSKAWSDISGYRPHEIPTFTEWVDKALGDQTYHVRERFDYVFENGRRVDEGAYTIRTRDGEKRLWHFYASALGKLPDGRRYIIRKAIDVTDAANAEHELRAREEQFRRAIIESPLPVMLFTEDSQVTLLSKAWTEITGYTPEQLPTLDAWVKLAYGQRTPHMQALLEERLHSSSRIDVGEFSVRISSGQQRIWHFYSSFLGHLPDGRKLFLAKAIDVTDIRITERRLQELNRTLEKRVEERTAAVEHMNEQLRQLASELTQTEQRERRQLAALMHDHLQQLVAGARIQVNLLTEPQNEADRRRINVINTVLDEAAQACRDVTTELAPAVLYDGGFAEALEWLCGWVTPRHNLHIECDLADRVEPVTQDDAVLLFQSVRELLFNVTKHAHVDTARIQLNAPEPGWLAVTVSDQGCGFDFQKVQREGRRSGFGLFSIRERIALIGGRMDVRTAPGQGASITLTARAKTT